MKRFLKEKLADLTFYLSAVLFLIAFNFSDNPVGNWYQQFMPNLNGRNITDVFFLDSLRGWAVSNNLSVSDTGFVLKTINGGDSWSINFTVGRTFSKVQFINPDTGFACGGTGGGTPYIYKTTNAGASWFVLSTFGCAQWRDMAVLSNDTIWIVDTDGLCGGVYLTTNGGASWTQKASYLSNPDHIYMFNVRIGFIGCNGGTRYVRKTTDGGMSWSLVVSNDYFSDMYFADSLVGWKCSVFGMKKTTNGGLNWITQILPSGGIIQTNGISSFSNISRDTIWGNGGYVMFPNGQLRDFLNRTTDGGNNWLFQIPDTGTINNIVYYYMNFTNKKHGWATDNIPTRGEIHTTTGGDTIFYTSVKQISSEIPRQYQLFQNYPNPFNSKSNIKYQISKSGFVSLRVFDITGRLVSILVEEKQSPGLYNVDFEGNDLSSGIYFYSLFAEGDLVETKKMILLK